MSGWMPDDGLKPASPWLLLLAVLLVAAAVGGVLAVAVVCVRGLVT